jgi:hypothetical protein
MGSACSPICARLTLKDVKSRKSPARFVQSAALLAGILAFAAGAPRITVQFHGGKLSLRTNAAPAADVFSAVAEKTGIRFVVDSEIKPGPISIDIDGMELERAIRNLLNEVPQAAGHTMSYAPGPGGEPRLKQVTLYGPGKAPSEVGATVYQASQEVSTPGPLALPTPDLEERMRKMIDAGVPRETAEKVMTLTREVQQLQATPAPGTFHPEDLSPATREQLQPLIDRGVPMERAVQMLLLQERYQETLKDLQKIPAPGPLVYPGATPLEEE